VGTILTGMVVGEAKKGVLVELGSIELLLPRSRFGTSGDRLVEAGYGAAVTAEVVATPEGGTALTRVGIDKSVRQPRPIEGVLRRQGSGLELVPLDGSAAFAVLVLDRLDPDALVGPPRTWEVGAPYRGIRLIAPVA
jgi:hypothetical protein